MCDFKIDEVPWNQRSPCCHSVAMNDEHLLDLQVQLRNDAHGERRADLLDRLRALHDDCLAARRQLHDRDAFRRIQAAGTAVAAAIRIVETLPQMHGGGN